jgi:hypothetical protein
MTTRQLPRGPLTSAFVWQAAVVAAALFSFVLPAYAQSTDATAILKKMSDYVSAQKTLSITFDSDVEVVTADLEKIQFNSSGQVQLSRPDKLRATRLGGYSDVELMFDGKTLTVNSKDRNKFAQIEAPGSVDQLVETLRDKYAVALPGADLLLARVFDELSGDVVVAKNIGRGVIDGVECHHLAFRNLEVDWQIWIDAGVEPIPRKYVITSKSVQGAPQYTLRIKEWRKEVSPDAFVFKSAAGATKVAIEALDNIDEVPPGIVATKEKK